MQGCARVTLQPTVIVKVSESGLGTGKPQLRPGLQLAGVQGASVRASKAACC